METLSEMEVIRKNSQYGNMKWLVIIRNATGGKNTNWFKTKNEAQDFINDYKLRDKEKFFQFYK